MITQAIVFAMSDIVLDILLIVTLGYLGLGIQPPTPDWGDDDRRGPDVHHREVAADDDPRRRGRHHRLGLSLIGDGLADLLRPE